jgi:hypothetical protein
VKRGANTSGTSKGSTLNGARGVVFGHEALARICDGDARASLAGDAEAPSAFAANR